jgi:hypothetical protein
MDRFFQILAVRPAIFSRAASLPSCSVNRKTARNSSKIGRNGTRFACDNPCAPRRR